MDIHKPKPWHGLREFLKEYVIIVVGVLTALAAEQGVEWLHWRRLATEADQHLVTELGPNLVSAAERIAIEPCLAARVRELATALQEPDPAWTSKAIERLPEDIQVAMPLVVQSTNRQWPKVAWENALASGVLAHLPRERVDGYAAIYRLAEVARQNQLVATTADAELAPLGFDRPMTSPERTAFLARLAVSERLDRAIFGESWALLNRANGSLGWSRRPRRSPPSWPKIMRNSEPACTTSSSHYPTYVFDVRSPAVADVEGVRI